MSADTSRVMDLDRRGAGMARVLRSLVRRADRPLLLTQKLDAPQQPGSRGPFN